MRKHSDTNSLTKTVEERDLGITVRNDLKPTTQCLAAASRGMSVIGRVKKNFKNLNMESFLVLDRTYIRPHLEYCVQVWSPHLNKDITLMEQVQGKEMKLVKSVSKLSYQQRLEKLELTTLEKWRGRGDMIEVYKLIIRKKNIDSNQFFQLASRERDLRGHSMILFQQRSRLDVRKYFFSQRVVGPWNACRSKLWKHLQ